MGLSLKSNVFESVRGERREERGERREERRGIDDRGNNFCIHLNK